MGRIGRIVSLVFGIIFIIYLCKRWDFLYDKTTSIQLITLIGLFGVLIVFLVKDFFSSSVLEFFVGDLSKLEKSTIETYFSSFVTILIGVVGVIAVILSVLYGAHMSPDTSEIERMKLSEQNLLWFIFSVYFVIVTFFLFIHPLMKKLRSFR